MLSSLNVQEHHVTGTSALDIEMQELENRCTKLARGGPTGAVQLK